jgi:4-amino-4-deoxy-L-arabinose transferase-like glycosyltransferase
MRRWSIVGLLAVLIFDVWLRCHTVGPSLKAKLGVDLYPVTDSASEPLDCDEAIYAYIGNRIAHGSVMYRDMTENKPPGGYWVYTLAVKLFGPNELTVRLMPIPLVLATIVLVWWIALRLRGPGSAVVGALIYAVVSTDPFLFGNGANMEHIINLFATASLACLVVCWERPGRLGVLMAGVCLGLASLVKQVAIVHALIYVVALLLRATKMTEEGESLRSILSRIVDVAALVLGIALVWGCAAGAVARQGAARDAYDDVFRYGRALATETPSPANAPPKWMRWVTGNADPQGNLPWPFGKTDYLVWWGAGSWPVWVATVPALAWLLIGPGTSGPRQLTAIWTLSAWIQVALPGLFWQHYYLLPVPGLAICIAVFLGDQFAITRKDVIRILLAVLIVPAILAALGWTAWRQWQEYLQVPPQQLTVRDKGGAQWIENRRLGLDLARRSKRWENPRLFIWGWQAPLYFYSGLKPATKQLFADDFIRAFAGTDHPLVRPRIERIMADLNANPPAIIFTGYPPFPVLRKFLDDRYLRSSRAPGLWIEKSKYGEFEAAGEAS